MPTRRRPSFRQVNAMFKTSVLSQQSSNPDHGNPLMNAFTNITDALGAPLTSPPENKGSEHALSALSRKLKSFAESPALPASPMPATANAAKQTNSAHRSPYTQQAGAASGFSAQMFSSPPSPLAPHSLNHSSYHAPRQHSGRPASSPLVTTPT